MFLSKYFIILLLLCNISSFAQSTHLDTIKLNKDLSATLEFDDNIDFIVLGNNPIVNTTQDGIPIYKYYDIFQTDNVVIFRVKSAEAPLTTLNIKLTNGLLYHGFISLSEKPQTTYYSFKSKQLLQEKKDKHELDSSAKAEIDLGLKLQKLKEMKAAIEDIALINKGVIFQVVNMVNDNQYMFFKVLLNNKTSNLYEVDGVTFKMTEGKKKSVKKQEISNQNWLSPVKTVYPQDKQIKAYSQDFIYFVVPMYSISTGSLTVKIIEKNGNRTGDIIIPAENLKNCKVF